MGSPNVDTCPKCGALTVPQLARCRVCKTYLHGTEAEAWLFESLLPESFHASPGTATILLLTLLYYALQLVLTVPVDPSSVLGFSSFSLLQLGATHGPSLLLGEYWRFVTSIFVHHDVLHLAFNMLSLRTAGPLVETIFDRKKMLFLYLLSGVGSMVVSFFWYVFFREDVGFVSAGASGAVCGLIGAGWAGAQRMGPQGYDVAKELKRWALYMVVWGFAMPGINNAAHLGGFVIAGGLALLLPLGHTRTVSAQRGLSVLLLVGFGGVAVSFGLMLAHLRGYPAALANDQFGRGILGIPYASGVAFEDSAQLQTWRRTRARLEADPASDDADQVSALNVRINAGFAGAYAQRGQVLQARGRLAEAEAYSRVAWRMAGRMALEDVVDGLEDLETDTSTAAP